MLRIAIVENSDFAKEFIFSLSKILDDEFSFRHFEKISEFLRSYKAKDFDIIVLNDAYNNIRVSEALEYSKNNTAIIYCSLEARAHNYTQYTRVFSLCKKTMQEDLQIIKPFLQERMNNHKEYFFSYNGINVRLKYHDIYYIEKNDKNLVYHTRMGEFSERGSIAKKSEALEPYDFIRIHSGIIVNYEYIFRVDNDELELINHVILPISRARKSSLTKFIRDKNIIGK